jgi:hypothetical protein
MGQAMGERGDLMGATPPKAATVIIGLLIPPACREEVLGDLHERDTSHGQYIWDALSTVPLVIMSRVRRTADPLLVLMQAFVLYLSFVGAAWYHDQTFLHEQSGLLRLALPSAVALAGIILEEAYAMPGKRYPLKPLRGPIFGLTAAFLTQADVPLWIMLYGSGLSLLLTTAVRLLFPPVGEHPLGANVPAHWLKQTAEPVKISPVVAGVILAVALLAVWIRNN